MPRICGRTLSPIGTRHFRRFSWNNAKHFDFHETKRPAGTIIYGTQAPSNEVSLSLFLLLSLFFSDARIANRKKERKRFLCLFLSFFLSAGREAGRWIHSVGFCATRRFSNPLLLFLQTLFLRQASQPVIDST